MTKLLEELKSHINNPEGFMSDAQYAGYLSPIKEGFSFNGEGSIDVNHLASILEMNSSKNHEELVSILFEQGKDKHGWLSGCSRASLDFDEENNIIVFAGQGYIDLTAVIEYID